MKKIAFLILTGAFSGCASLVSKYKYPISLSSKPSGAEVTVVNMRNGVTIFNGATPTYLSLRAGHKFFKRAEYQATFTLAGYETMVVPLEFKVDAWYLGNVLFGTAIGFLIVDPATGAMYKPKKEFIVANLQASTTSAQIGALHIYTIDEIPAHWKDHLTEVVY